MSYAEEEESDRLDGELIVRVLSLMDFTDRHLNKVVYFVFKVHHHVIMSCDVLLCRGVVSIWSLLT